MITVTLSNSNVRKLNADAKEMFGADSPELTKQQLQRLINALIESADGNLVLEVYNDEVFEQPEQEAA